MTDIAKVIETSSSSTSSLEDAVQKGLSKIAETITGIQGAWIKEIKVRTSPDGEIIEWRAFMKVTFIVE